MSRILGFARDILIARFLGATVVADAFFAAFRFPNMFRRIFGEGAFNSAFVPLFGKRVVEGGTQSAMGFANNAFSVLFLVLGVLTVLLIPVMAFVMFAVVVFQFLSVLFTSDTNPNLLSFGQALSCYQYQIMLFLTYNSEEQPFPVGSWPSN